ncbi:MAG: plasmid pRiA4b ORF-3 family protein [Methanotrichaceae archaeon]
MPARKKKSQPSDEGASGKASSKLYTLVVYLIGGSAGGEFEGQTISRTIQIRGDQTLEDLHRAIFKAFNRFDEHLYEFMLNVGPSDKIATYSLPIYETVPAFEEEMAGDVRTTIIDSLGLEVDQEFGYRFDFGDNWEHQIRVTAIEETSGKGRYPKVVERVGKSPPQYPDEDEE